MSLDQPEACFDIADFLVFGVHYVREGCSAIMMKKMGLGAVVIRVGRKGTAFAKKGVRSGELAFAFASGWPRSWGWLDWMAFVFAWVVSRLCRFNRWSFLITRVLPQSRRRNLVSDKFVLC